MPAALAAVAPLENRATVAARKLLAAGGAAEEAGPPARSALQQMSAAEATARATATAAKAAGKASRAPAPRGPAAEAEPPQASPPRPMPPPTTAALKHSSRLFEFKDLLQDASPPAAAAASPAAAAKGSRKRLKRKGSLPGVVEGADGGAEAEQGPTTPACRSSKRARRTPGAWWEGGEFTWERTAPPL